MLSRLQVCYKYTRSCSLNNSSKSMCVNFANPFKGCGSPNTKKMTTKLERGGRQCSSLKFLTFSYISWSYFCDLLHKDEAKSVMNTWCPNPCFVVCSPQTTKKMGRALLKRRCARDTHKTVLATIDIYLTPRVSLIMESKSDVLR